MAQVTVDTGSVVTANSDTDDFNTGNVTLSTDQGLVVVVFHEVSDSGKRVNEVFWDPSGVNESLTSIGTNWPSHAKMGQSLWYIDAPTIKAAPVRVHIIDGNANKLVVHCLPIDNGDLSAIDSFNTAEATASGDTVTLASPGQDANGLAIFTGQKLATNAITWNDSETEVTDVSAQGYRSSTSYEDGTGTTTGSWTAGGGNKENSTCGFHIPEAASAVTNELAVDVRSASTLSADIDVTDHLVADVRAASTATADLTSKAFNLASADVQAASTATAALTVVRPVTAGVAAASSATAALKVERALSADTTATSTVTAALKIERDIAAGITAVSTVSADPDVALQVAADIASVSTASADLTIIRPVTASVAAASTVTGDIDVTDHLVAAVTSVSTVSASLSVTVPGQSLLDAAPASASTVTASLTSQGQTLADADVQAASTVSAELIQTQPVTAAAASVSTVNASLTNKLPALELTADTQAASTVTVTGLTVGTRLTADTNTASTVSATLDVTTHLDTTVASVSVVTATLLQTHDPTATTAAASTVAASLLTGYDRLRFINLSDTSHRITVSDTHGA